MNKQNQLKLAVFFDEVAEGELALDLLKCQLAATKGYSAEALFSHIAQGAPTISIGQLTEHLERKFAINERQVYTLFERFDGSRQGVITREDFLKELTPQNNPRKNPANISKVTPEVEAFFVSLIKEYINRQRILDICRKDLEGIPPYHAFDEVAVDQKGFLGFLELKDFMRRCDMSLKDEQLALIMHSLKRRHYRYVTLEVFCENLWPLEFGYYKNFEERLKEQGDEQYLKRSRMEDEEAERKRLDKQRLEAEIKKNERRIQAEAARNFQTERQLRDQINKDMEVQARISRRAELQAQKMSRWSIQKDDLLLHEEARLAEIARARRLEAEVAKRNEEEIALRLERNAQANIYDIEASRRQIQLEREAFNRQALLQEQVRADISRQRAARLARQAEQERLRLREEALLEQERQLVLERQCAREALLRREIQYERLRPLPPATILTATPPRFSYTLNNYELPRREGHIASANNYSGARPSANSYSFSASKPTTGSITQHTPSQKPLNYNQSASASRPNNTLGVPTTAQKYEKDRSLPGTAEDSRKRVTFSGDRDLKKSYIV